MIDIESSSQTTIFLQDACLQHRFIRSKDASSIVERPERLRAVNVGLSAAISRLESALIRREDFGQEIPKRDADSTDALTAALDKLKLAPSPVPTKTPVRIIKSDAKVNILNNAAVKYIHGDIEGDVYLENLVRWSRESRDRISQDGTEIIATLSQGDLYLCPESIDAVQGALGTVCEAVDTVITDSEHKRAFVAIRPPGHHCGEDTPSGFCFVNNVAVAAAHAHLKHGINRIIIFDIDLHHGNGTQSIVWQINEETYRNEIEASYGSQAAKVGPKVFYGSLHDVRSYPCEDGKPELVQAASVSIHGAHGQYIENVHLETYNSDEEFFEKLYEKHYVKLFQKAEDFIQETGGAGEDVLVFISAGFDASQHEHQSMQRHARRVPTSFYYRFTLDARTFADQFARGRLISVLEGGYSDLALMSGVMAHIVGLASGEGERERVDEGWWDVEKLTALEKATKKRKGGRASLSSTASSGNLSDGASEQWLQRTLEILSTIDTSPPPSKPVVRIPPSSRSLRQKPASTSGASNTNDQSEKEKSGKANGQAKAKAKDSGTARSKPKPRSSLAHNSPPPPPTDTTQGSTPPPVRTGTPESQSFVPVSHASEEKSSEENQQSQQTATTETTKKLPRVILKLGSKPNHDPDTQATEPAPSHT